MNLRNSFCDNADHASKMQGHIWQCAASRMKQYIQTNQCQPHMVFVLSLQHAHERTNADLDLCAVQHCQVIDNIQHGTGHLQHAVDWPSKLGLGSIFIMSCNRIEDALISDSHWARLFISQLTPQCMASQSTNLQL